MRKRDGREDKRNISLICLDWEGCATLPGGGRVPWPTAHLAQLQKTVQRLVEPLILVTGRQAPYGEAGLQAIGAFSSIPSVLENGVVLYYPKTKKYSFNQALTDPVRSAISRFRGIAWEWGQKNGLVPELGKEICISMSAADGSLLPSLLEKFRREFEEMLPVLDVTHSMSALDITPKGVNKWTGLKQVLDGFGIRPNNVLGIGDAKNDHVWLAQVGVPCCPANADEATKKLVQDCGGFVASQECTKGVLEIIYHFGLVQEWLSS